jgi:hypothetical protein
MCVHSESRQRTKNQREKSTYVEISKLPDSKPAFQSPCKIWSKLKAKTDMDDFDNQCMHTTCQKSDGE